MLSSRVLFRCVSLFASLSLVTACSGGAKGECTGTYQGQPVTWPMDSGATSLLSTRSPRYGTEYRDARLVYTVGESQQFGAEMDLHANIVVDEASGPRTVALTGSDYDIKVNDEAVLLWQGYYGDNGGGGTGFLPPGPPQSGTLRIEALVNDSSDERFAGLFSYHYADGSDLSCSFDVDNF